MEIDLTTLGILSSATQAFLQRSDNITGLIPGNHPFFSVESAIKEKEHFPKANREILVEILREQYKRLDIKDNLVVNANIEALLSENTFTVTTGQQLHLFMGPAFMIYKLISTVKAAKEFESKFPGKKFIPVYWLASEDHDFAEIRNTPLFGQNYEWQTIQSGACGNYHLRDLPTLFGQLKQKLANDPKALSLIGEFETIYSSSSTLSDATIKLTHHLFSQYGLICIDANTHRLKSLFIPIIKKELLERKSEQAFNTFSGTMSDKGLSLQLKSRDINLFYLKEDSRDRITYEGGNYKVVGTDITFNEEAMLAEVDAFPERFSPNALLRPVYQETVLPNIAYIGGNAEINYWLQLKDVFELYGTGAANLILRQSIWILKSKQMEWLQSHNIALTDLFNVRSEQDKLKMVAQSDVQNPYTDIAERFKNIKSEILDHIAGDRFSNLKEVSETGKGLEKHLKELVKMKHEQMAEKNSRELSKLDQLLNSGFGSRHIQERTVYTIEYLISHGNYIDQCFNNTGSKTGHGYFFTLQ